MYSDIVTRFLWTRIVLVRKVGNVNEETYQRIHGLFPFSFYGFFPHADGIKKAIIIFIS